jgi:hypothetical protein
MKIERCNMMNCRIHASLRGKEHTRHSVLQVVLESKRLLKVKLKGLLEEDVLAGLKLRSKEKSSDDENKKPTSEYFDKKLSCFNVINQANISMN